MTCHTHHVVVYPGSGPGFLKAFKKINGRMGSRSKCLILILSYGKTQEKYKTDLWSPEWTPGDKTLVMGTPKKSHQDFEFSWENPKSTFWSTELNTGRSETNEGSVSITSTFHAQCAEN